MLHLRRLVRLVGITLAKPRLPSRSVYRAAVSAGSNDSVEDYYRINVFFPALDEILQDVHMRFGPKRQLDSKFIRAVPAFMNFDDPAGDWDMLQTAVYTYIDMLSDPILVIKSEYASWRRTGNSAKQS